MGSAVGGFFSRIILCSAVASAGILLLPGSAAPASKSDPSEKPPGAVEVAQVASTSEVTTSSECSSSAAPVCVPGHTCECLAFQATMTRARPVLRRARRDEGRINEQILIDLSDGAENGAGGSCFPWNGVGLLSIKKSTIAMPQHGRVVKWAHPWTNFRARVSSTWKAAPNNSPTPSGKEPSASPFALRPIARLPPPGSRRPR